MTQLCRNCMIPLLTDQFSAVRGTDPHPGLLFSKGLSRAPAEGEKAIYIEEVSKLPVSGFYQSAFERWKKITCDPARFMTFSAMLAGRLYVGVVRDNSLETGVTISHTYGMPVIPGSAVKGLCHASAEEWLDNEEACRWLFGQEGNGDDEGAEIGGLIFHDAWWLPDGKPFALETVTTHHPGYYGAYTKPRKEGSQDPDVGATDFDSPIPAPQIAVRGSFLFAVEGPPLWTKLAARLLAEGLTRRGIGGKRSSGYGLFVVEGRGQ